MSDNDHPTVAQPSMSGAVHEPAPRPLGPDPDPIDSVIADLVKDLPPMVTLAATAELFHVDVRSVRRWVRAGRLKVIRTAHGGGGRVLVPRVELARLLVSMKLPGPTGAA